MIVDASVVLASFFPDEDQAQAQAVIRDHVADRLQLGVINIDELERLNWRLPRCFSTK